MTFCRFILVYISSKPLIWIETEAKDWAGAAIWVKIKIRANTRVRIQKIVDIKVRRSLSSIKAWKTFLISSSLLIRVELRQVYGLVIWLAQKVHFKGNFCSLK